MSTREIDCSGKGSVVSFLKARNFSSALLFSGHKNWTHDRPYVRMSQPQHAPVTRSEWVAGFDLIARAPLRTSSDLCLTLTLPFTQQHLSELRGARTGL